MRYLLCCMLMVSVLGCSFGGSGGSGSSGDSTDHTYDAIAKQFGQSVLKGDWASAYAMTTPEFQATTSQADLQKEYDDLIAEIKQSDPTFKPNYVEIDHGDLPIDEKEAKDTYGFKTMPPKSQWRAWLFSLIGEGNEKDGMDRGVEARLFVVDQNGQGKFAHVEFGFQD